MSYMNAPVDVVWKLDILSGNACEADRKPVVTLTFMVELISATDSSSVGNW